MTSIPASHLSINAPFLREIPRSVYVHVPFCLHRCGYCDFTLIAGRDELIPAYLQALEIELETTLHKKNYPITVETIYLGGGTPTQLSAESLSHLLTLLKRYFSLDTKGEYTIEANPVGLTADKLKLLNENGVNRISLGVQAFSTHILKTLERDHTPEYLATLLPIVFRNCTNVSLDLIFGVPGMSLESWEDTLVQALSYHPQHLSTYCLTIEKGTSFWTRQSHGETMQIHNDLEAEMFALTNKILTSRGYEHYEVSSYALPGFRSRHNSIYWQAKPYYAFGPGASRFIDGVRETNDRSVTRYIRQFIEHRSCKIERDELPLYERIKELLIVGLRQRDGISRQNFTSRMGVDPCILIEKLPPNIHEQHWLEIKGDNIRITDRGILFYDTIAHHLLNT
jgi:oxygen-independent coproporphyrinogen-3 oxidase